MSMMKSTKSKPSFRFSLVEMTAPNGYNLRFFITKAPNESNLDNYITELKNNNIKNVARVCQPTYSKDLLLAEGIKVHDWYFNDGKTPSKEIISAWLSLVEKVFSTSTATSTSHAADSRSSLANESASASSSSTSSSSSSSPSAVTAELSENGDGIAIHCVAGLGRAPIMAAIACICMGVPNVDVIKHIRTQVPGCFNQNQIKFLMSFSPSKKKCIIM